MAGEPIGDAELDALIRPQLADLRAQEQQLRLKADRGADLAGPAQQGGGRPAASARRRWTRRRSRTRWSSARPTAKAFYDANKARFGSTPEAEAIKQTLQGLGQQRRGERRAAFTRELRAKYGVKVLLEPYRAPVELDGAPIRGNVNAPVTVLEFSDFQCPYCVRARPTVARVRETYGDKVRWAFRHFPLDFHALAQKAGEAAACAGEQGKFWEMHDRLWASERPAGGPRAEEALPPRSASTRRASTRASIPAATPMSSSGTSGRAVAGASPAPRPSSSTAGRSWARSRSRPSSR